MLCRVLPMHDLIDLHSYLRDKFYYLHFQDEKSVGQEGDVTYNE